MWLYNGVELSEVPEKMLGFVYLIEDKANNKAYIGKKNFYASKTKQVKGKKKKIKVESDWREYFGSNEALKEQVELHGHDKFVRTILHICPSLGTLGYLEAREQFDRRVLESDYYYNGWIMIRSRADHIKLLDKIETAR